MSQPPARPGGGMSGLYANLLGDTTTPKSSSATVSKAPVVFAKPSAGASGPHTAEDTASGNTNAQKKINAGSHAHATFPAWLGLCICCLNEALLTGCARCFLQGIFYSCATISTYRHETPCASAAEEGNGL